MNVFLCYNYSYHFHEWINNTTKCKFLAYAFIPMYCVCPCVFVSVCMCPCACLCVCVVCVCMCMHTIMYVTVCVCVKVNVWKHKQYFLHIIMHMSTYTSISECTWTLWLWLCTCNVGCMREHVRACDCWPVVVGFEAFWQLGCQVEERTGWWKGWGTCIGEPVLGFPQNPALHNRKLKKL